MNNGITAIEYSLGEDLLSLEALEQQGLLESAAGQLHEFGFGFCRISRRSGRAPGTKGRLRRDWADGIPRDHDVQRVKANSQRSKLTETRSR